MRTILISGANSGIGLKIAHKLLSEGNRVSLGIRNIETLKDSIIDPEIWPKNQISINYYDAFDENSSQDWITTVSYTHLRAHET